MPKGMGYMEPMGERRSDRASSHTIRRFPGRGNKGVDLPLQQIKKSVGDIDLGKDRMPKGGNDDTRPRCKVHTGRR